MERSFVMIKPDSVDRGLVGRIVSRFEDSGLALERMELTTLSRAQAEANYAEHEGKPFYEDLVDYVTSGPVVRMVVSGVGAVAICRKLIGATDPAEAAPGTIRGDLGIELSANLVHGSDSVESADREIGIFFDD
jgi:nucleoside-diphosphate kinase